MKLLAFVLFLAAVSNLAYAQQYSDYTGQWAVSAVASNQMSTSDYSASQATGEPNTPSCGDYPTAWTTESTDMGMQWIRLNYVDYVYANGVDIVESYNPGFISRVDLIDDAGVNHTVWQGKDSTAQCSENLSISFPTAGYKTRTVSLYVNTDATMYAFEELDAVMLRGYRVSLQPTSQTNGSAPLAFSNFVASPAVIKRSGTAFFNLTILDSTGIGPANTLLQIISPTKETYSTRPVLVSGDGRNGVYSANWTAPRDAASGVYKMFLFACGTDNNCPTLSVGNFTLNGTLSFTGAMANAEYSQTDEIALKGGIVDALNNTVTNATINLVVSSIAGTVYSAKGVSGNRGNFTIRQRTTLLDNPGNWKLSLKAADSDGNEGEYNVDFKLMSSPASLYYNILFLSPTSSESYFRGENMRISVKVLDLDKPVGEANVSLKLPTGEIVPMSEVDPGAGVYVTSYGVKFGDNAGNWVLGVEALKQGTQGLFGGGKSINISVRPVDLKIDVLSPTKNRFVVGEETEVKAKVSYSDGSPASGIVVNATPTSRSMALFESESGVYSGTYTFGENDVGRSKLRVFATDGFDNTGFVEPVIFITKPGIVEYMATYWYITLAVLLLITFGVAQLIVPSYYAKRYENEIRRLKAMEEDLQKKYFVEGSIDEKTYNKSMEDSKRMIVEATSKMRSLEKGKSPLEGLLSKISKLAKATVPTKGTRKATRRALRKHKKR